MSGLGRTSVGSQYTMAVHRAKKRKKSKNPLVIDFDVQDAHDGLMDEHDLNDIVKAISSRAMRRGGALIAQSMTPEERSARTKKGWEKRKRARQQMARSTASRRRESPAARRRRMRSEVGARAESRMAERRRQRRTGLAEFGTKPFSQDQLDLFEGGSATQHVVPDGKGGFRFTEERQAVHREIARRFLEGVPVSSNPTLFMMGGGPAAGKSTITGKPGVKLPEDGQAVLIDSDAIKGMIPEYEDMTRSGDRSAAAFAHEESSYIAKLIQAEAIKNKQDVLLDGTGNSKIESVRRKINAAREAGYSVGANYVTIPTDVAVERAAKRAERSGRLVPESVIRHTHAAVSAVFPDVVDDFDDISLFDNSSDGPPTLVARKVAGGELEILDQDLYRTFLAKAKEVEL